MNRSYDYTVFIRIFEFVVSYSSSYSMIVLGVAIAVRDVLRYALFFVQLFTAMLKRKRRKT